MPIKEKLILHLKYFSFHPTTLNPIWPAGIQMSLLNHLELSWNK